MASISGARAVHMADIRIISSIGFSAERISSAQYQDVVINAYLVEAKFKSYDSLDLAYYFAN
jgi:hypothetical protein